MQRKRKIWRLSPALMALGMLTPRLAGAASGWDAIAVSTCQGSALSSQASGPDVSRSAGGSSNQSSNRSSDNSSKSSDDSSAESSGSSDSSRDDPPQRRPRKLIVPQQVRDEAALHLASPVGLPTSTLLRATLQAFREQLAYEGRGRPQTLGDRELLSLLLQRAEGVTPGGARLVHAQAVRGPQSSSAESRVERRQQADDQRHAPDESHLGPRDVRR
jgi:hypothetical protein